MDRCPDCGWWLQLPVLHPVLKLHRARMQARLKRRWPFYVDDEERGRLFVGQTGRVYRLRRPMMESVGYAREMYLAKGDSR